MKNDSAKKVIWRELHPREAAGVLAAASAPWWIAGGWALDLFCGTTTRQHVDVDVGVLRTDVLSVLQAISTWQVYEARDGSLTTLESDHLPRRDVYCLWCRPTSAEPWTIEVMLDEGDRDVWIYRRDPRVRRPMSQVVHRSEDGLPYLAPEIQLLYKSKAARARDDVDFRNCLRLLSPDARRWLHEAISLADPSHHWLTHLRA